MLLLVGLFSVGPLCAEISCAGDDCAREVVVVRDSAAESRGIESETLAPRPASGFRPASEAARIPVSISLRALSAYGGHGPLRI